jgi:hypothetical protein
MTDESKVDQATLAALAGWAARRDRLPADRADLLAAAWWAGTRNVAELARAADTARDTVYADLRSRGIEPTDRAATSAQRPRQRYEPLRPEVVHELAKLTERSLLPSMLTTEPGPLVDAAWQMSAAYANIAGLLNGASSAIAADLADRTSSVLELAHRHWASLLTPAELAGETSYRLELDMDRQAITETAEVTLAIPPNGKTITVQLGREADHSATPGWTTVRSNSSLLDTAIDGEDHLNLQQALAVIAEVMTKHLPDEAFEDD